MSSTLKKDILRAGSDDKDLARKAMKRVIREIRQNPAQRYLMGTSQAVDIIDGGVKGIAFISKLITVNALPESVYAIVNHRIAMESSVKEVEDHLVELITPLSKSLHATFVAFDKQIYAPSQSDNPRNTTITLSTTPDALEPAPVSPEDSYAWGVLSNTVKNVFGAEAILAPSLMTGNTDTKFYWDLTKDIWRFTPIRPNGRGNAHTVDEFVGAKDHVDVFGFYVKLIRYADG